MGKSRCPTKGWNREGVSLQAQKFELFPSVGYHPHQKIKSPCPFPDHRPNIKKKCISNSFQTNFTQNFACGVHFQLHKRDIWKSSLELKKQKLYGKPKKQKTQQPKIYLFLPPEKNPLVNLMSRQRKCHSFFIKQQFSSQNPIQAPFVAVVIAVVSFFLTSGFTYTQIKLILITRCLQNIVFSMAKALNGQSSSEQNFYSPQHSMLFEKPCLS